MIKLNSSFTSSQKLAFIDSITSSKSILYSSKVFTKNLISKYHPPVRFLRISLKIFSFITTYLKNKVSYDKKITIKKARWRLATTLPFCNLIF